ncbi:DUF58 domain-containing protein [Gilvimarinus polysaccharolyticus]|uniref:DUF58 domain-containing protein n=1 Tax=Gilvimarinus polysaccharolyticus TaxID=863921 RepID=UPI00067357E8|nr:DUF58 domain-containing protein [Gilvimarinus polysaccharolyticus]
MSVIAKPNASGAFCDMASLLRARFAARELNLFARRPARSMQSGRLRTRFRGRGVDFEEVRLYQPGDDIRAIDWRVTARTQVPHTKLYSEERERPVYILCDQRPEMFFGSVNCFKSVLACHISALLSWAALEGGDRLGALGFNDQEFRDLRPKRSKHNVLAALQLLQSFNHKLTSPIGKGPLTLAQMLKDTRRIAKPGSALFIVSDLHDLDAEAEKQLFHLHRHLDITLIRTHDPLERAISGSGQLTITNGQERQQLPVGDKHFQAQYRALNEQREQLLTDTTQRLGLEVIDISTRDEPIERLRQRFGRQQRTSTTKRNLTP